MALTDPLAGALPAIPGGPLPALSTGLDPAQSLYYAQLSAYNDQSAADSAAQLQATMIQTHLGAQFTISMQWAQTMEVMGMQAESFAIQVWQNMVAQAKKLNQISSMAV